MSKTWKIEDVYRLNEGDLRFFGHMGIRSIAEEDACVRVEMPVPYELMNSHGTVQGGAVSALCDIACAAYLRIRCGDGVTLSSSTNFYHPAEEGSVLTAKVTPRKEGRTVVTLLCEVTDQNGTRIADSVQTMYRMGFER